MKDYEDKAPERAAKLAESKRRDKLANKRLNDIRKYDLSLQTDYDQDEFDELCSIFNFMEQKQFKECFTTGHKDVETQVYYSDPHFCGYIDQMENKLYYTPKIDSVSKLYELGCKYYDETQTQSQS